MRSRVLLCVFVASGRAINLCFLILVSGPRSAVVCVCVYGIYGPRYIVYIYICVIKKKNDLDKVLMRFLIIMIHIFSVIYIWPR